MGYKTAEPEIAWDEPAPIILPKEWPVTKPVEVPAETPAQVPVPV